MTAALGDDGAVLRGGRRCSPTALVVVAFGAGHLTPGMLRRAARGRETDPGADHRRPERSQMLFATYGFEGAEPDLRATGAVCVPFLSPVAARIALLCCLGAGAGARAIASALAPWDARLR